MAKSAPEYRVHDILVHHLARCFDLHDWKLTLTTHGKVHCQFRLGLRDTQYSRALAMLLLGLDYRNRMRRWTILGADGARFDPVTWEECGPLHTVRGYLSL